MLKQSRSKQQSLAKLVYEDISCLNASQFRYKQLSRIRNQPFGRISDKIQLDNIIIQVIRKSGSNSKKLDELQGGIEGDIFHVLFTLDQLSITCTSLLQHLKKNNNNCDLSLNRLLTQVMESIYKEKYNSYEIDEQNNLRQRCELSIFFESTFIKQLLLKYIIICLTNILRMRWYKNKIKN